MQPSSDLGAGGSLGPEAALLALCGSTTSWLAQKVFGARGQMLRNCALMGMTAGLAAFFGVALGGTSEACLAPQYQLCSCPSLGTKPIGKYLSEACQRVTITNKVMVSLMRS